MQGMEVDSFSDKEITKDPIESYLVCLVHLMGTFRAESQANVYTAFNDKILTIVKKYNGIFVKNIDNDLFFYFPDTFNFEKGEAFECALETSVAILSARFGINEMLVEEGLPEISYNISNDYTNLNLRLFKSKKSISFEVFRAAFEFCRQINMMAPENSIIIGEDLYAIVKRFSFQRDYNFQKLPDLVYGKHCLYPVYLVSKEYNSQS